MNKERNILPLGLRIIACLMLICASSLFGVMADLPHIPLVVFAAMPLVLLKKEAFAFTDRTIIYSALVAIATATFLGYLFPHQRGGRLGIFSFFFRPEYYPAIAVNLALASLLFRSRPLAIGLVIMSVYLMLGYCGDALNMASANERITMFDELLNKQYPQVFFIFSSVLTVLSIILLQYVRHPAGTPQKLPRHILFIVACLIFAGTASFFLACRQQYLEGLRSVDDYIVGAASGRLRNFQYQGQSQFSGEVDINAPMPRPSAKSQAKILLRAKGPSAPGYLRSQAFVKYDRGRWQHDSKQTTLSLSFEEQSGMLSLSIYTRDDLTPDDAKTWDILFDKSLHNDTLPIPQPAARIELAAEDLKMDANGIATPDIWKKSAGYRVSTTTNANGAFDLPNKIAGNEQLLEVPAALKKELAKFIASIPGYSKTASPVEQVKILTQFFTEQFTYGFSDDIKPDTPRTSQDPVMHFLRDTRIGHCELFASATVLLLRCAGIPARYVTGFICVEEAPGGYYVARNVHAHAWCEIYDAASSQWHILDTTPPQAFPDFSDDWSFTASQSDNLRYLLDKFMANVRRGYIAVVIVDAFSKTWHILVITGIIIWLIIRARRKRQNLPLIQLTEDQQKLARQMEKLMRYWEKQLYLSHDESRTPRELLALIKASTKHSQFASQIEQQILTYEKQRFK